MQSIVGLAESSDELHRTVSRFSNLMAAAARNPEALTYSKIVPLRQRLELIEQISDAIRSLTRHCNHFRRSEARALYEDGLTMSELARVFGISRQRVSMMLREPSGDEPTAIDDAELDL
jgi:DNA invertase Pin-like site-specific DNA recombinase